MKQSLVVSVALLICSSAGIAAPTVSGNTISWPDDGWYQVQDAETYMEVCGGGRSCRVDPGNYIVINHSTGERFGGIVVGDSSEAFPISVTDTTITWPDDGWYQVQNAQTYESSCEGGRSCDVLPGTYNVINLTSGQRYEGIVVGTDSPSTDPVGASPARVNFVNVSYENLNSVALSWAAVDDSRLVSRYDIFDEGVLIDSTTDSQWSSSTVDVSRSHDYSVVAVSQDGISSEPRRLYYRLNDSMISAQSPRECWIYGIQMRDNTAVVSNAGWDLDGITPMRKIFYRDEQNDWHTKNLAATIQDGSYRFALNTNVMSLGSDSLVVRAERYPVDDTFDREPFWLLFAHDGEGNFSLYQALERDGSDVNAALDNDTLLIANRSFNGSETQKTVRVYRRDAGSGQWGHTQSLNIDEQASSRHNYDFGKELFVRGDTAFIGSEGDSDLLRLSRNDEDLWEQGQILNIESIHVGERGIDFDGQTLAVDVASRGSEVLLFQRNDMNAFVQVDALVKTDSNDPAETHVTVDGPWLAIGKWLDARNFYESGTIYLYKFSDGKWQEQKPLAGDRAPEAGEFGQYIAIEDGQLFAPSALCNSHLEETRLQAEVRGYIFELD